jgi:hypothetical protein
MKQCLVCLAHVAADLPTCLLCGEASWSATIQVEPVADTDPATESTSDDDVHPEVTTEDASPHAKRGRRK